MAISTVSNSSAYLPLTSPRSAAAGAAAKAAGEDARPVERNQQTEERQALEQLKARDREVRAHEQAHLAAAGGLVRGGMDFTYQRGPDGRLYAVAGEVGIDTSPVAGDPQATLLKAEQIRRAALAPVQPSGQDRAVAAQAAQMAAEARLDLSRRSQDEAVASGNRLDVYA